jgi:hypothetical protein
MLKHLSAFNEQTEGDRVSIYDWFTAEETSCTTQLSGGRFTA